MAGMPSAPAQKILDQLVEAADLRSRSEILARPSPVPRGPGIYGFFFDPVPPGVPVSDCARRGNSRLLYLGIAPSRPGTKSHLRTRLRSHLRGNASGSTLRLTLGCLLERELEIALQPTGATRRLTFGPGEALLSDWIERSARVVWVTVDEPWAVERELIEAADLPLNLEFNGSHPFHATLSETRRAARRRARGIESG